MPIRLSPFESDLATNIFCSRFGCPHNCRSCAYFVISDAHRRAATHRRRRGGFSLAFLEATFKSRRVEVMCERVARSKP